MTGRRILIVDHHPLCRVGLTLAAQAALPGAEITGAGSIAEAETAMKNASFRLLLLEYLLPDAHGYSGFLRLQGRDPDMPIVIVTAREDAPLIAAARALGGAGYLFKTLSIDDVAAKLRIVLSGGTAFPGVSLAANDVAAIRAKITQLSRAQRRVLMALTDGRSNKQIAHDLDVTQATVKAHLTAIFRTMGVSNRAQALLAAGPILKPD